MVRSSHHLPLPSLPPPRVVLCSPFAMSLSLSSSSSPLPPRKFEGEPGLRRRGIAASHLSRGPGPAESLPICKRVADGHHCHPAAPPPLGIYRHYIGGQISRMPATFFQSPTSPGRSPVSLSLRVQPPVNHTLPRDIPITNSTPTRSAVSPGFRNTRIVPLVNVFAS